MVLKMNVIYVQIRENLKGKSHEGKTDKKKKAGI